MAKDYYQILGVPKTASTEDIIKAFHKLAHQYHPDKASGNEAKFKEINEAYQVLSDKNKRAQYDRFGSADFQGSQAGPDSRGGFDFSQFYRGEGNNGFNINFGDFGDFGDIFGDLFGFKNTRTNHKTSNQGRDLEISIKIDFLTSIFGGEQTITLDKLVPCPSCQGSGSQPGASYSTCPNCGGRGFINQVQRTMFGSMNTQTVCPTCEGEGTIISQPCSKCHGEGRILEKQSLTIKIPAGVSNGQTIKFTGQGEAGRRSGPSGDLYVKVKVQPHPRLKREGDDIKSTVNISFRQAALGDKIKIETVDGPVVLKIPPGTQSGQVIILRGKGVPKLHGYGRGNHLIEVRVITPTKLTKEQREALEKLD